MPVNHQKMYTQIGLNILYYRKVCGMTQQQLADRTNYSRNHIQQIETAAAVPSAEALLNIADALGVPAEKLFQCK